MGHLKFSHQFLYRADSRIYFQYPTFEIVICSDQRGKHSGKLFSLVQSPEFHKYDILLETLIMGAQQTFFHD